LYFLSASSLTYSFPRDYLFILFRSLTLPEPERRRTESPQSRARTGQRLARGHPRQGDVHEFHCTKREFVLRVWLMEQL
jgi:hypothetical protein